MAVLEAAASGVPIAATPVGVASELADAGAVTAARGFGPDDLGAAMECSLLTGTRLGGRAR